MVEGDATDCYGTGAVERDFVARFAG